MSIITNGFFENGKKDGFTEGRSEGMWGAAGIEKT
tara:strand:- start:142 stop:246 length:105 start_codon:yes stop_codon:yes gene_type:complete